MAAGPLAALRPAPGARETSPVTDGIALGDIARIVDGELDGDKAVRITGAGTLDSAREGDIAYLDNLQRLVQAERSLASALIVPTETPRGRKPLIRTADPRFAFSKVLGIFAPTLRTYEGIHPTAVVGDNLLAGQGISLGALAYVGSNVTLGDNVIVAPRAFVGDDVRIGANTIIHPAAVIHDRTTIGSDCIIHSGAVIGSDGFGYVPAPEGHRKVPQIGCVIIGDRVEIGANATIDRATVAATIIEDGTKIDNLVHVAHNCVIGSNCIICGQAGLCGSANLEDNVTLGGQVGVQGHITIGQEATIGAQAGVISDVPAGVLYSGYPAGPHGKQMRMHALMRRLPEMEKRLRKLEELLREDDK